MAAGLNTTTLSNPCTAELAVTIFIHLNLEMLAQFPDSRDKKMLI